MALTPFLAMIRKDLQLFFSDRRAVIMSFAVPIAIASFFGSIFSGPTRNSERARISVGIVDLDGSAHLEGRGQRRAGGSESARAHADRGRCARLGAGGAESAWPSSFRRASATRRARRSSATARSRRSSSLFDPSRSVEVAMMRGILTEHVMQAVSKEMFGGEQGRTVVAQALPRDREVDDARRSESGARRDARSRSTSFYKQPAGAPGNSGPRGITMPYSVREQPMTSGENVAYNGYAHSFAGMGIQFLLFAAGQSRHRDPARTAARIVETPAQRADLASCTLLAGKVASMTIVGLMTLLVVVRLRDDRVRRPHPGQSDRVLQRRAGLRADGVDVRSAHRRARQIAGGDARRDDARGADDGDAGRRVGADVHLPRVAAAGSPSIVPVRWAVDGLDAMTWRGTRLERRADADRGARSVSPVLFWTVAVLRFRWEEA